MPGISRLLPIMSLFLAAACASPAADPAETPAPAPEGQNARLDVRNRSSHDMDVYAVRSGQRIRLGIAPGGETTRFTLAAGITSGGSRLHFEAIPLRQVGVDTGGIVRTDPVQARAGDVVLLDVPPQ